MWLFSSFISRDKYNSTNIQQMFWNLATTLLRGGSLFTWECIPRWWIKRDAWLAIISLNTSDNYAHQPIWTQQWVWPSAPKYGYNSILAIEFMRKRQGVLRNTGFRQVPWKFSCGNMCCYNSDMHSHFHSSLKVHNLYWRGTAEGCHFWSILLSIGATVHALCTLDQKVAEKFYLTENKYTPVHDATYCGKKLQRSQIFLCCYLLEED